MILSSKPIINPTPDHYLQNIDISSKKEIELKVQSQNELIIFQALRSYPGSGIDNLIHFVQLKAEDLA